ncbi:hypothetical protein CR513_45479, partial [Mucuna pruriens]
MAIMGSGVRLLVNLTSTSNLVAWLGLRMSWITPHIHTLFHVCGGHRELETTIALVKKMFPYIKFWHITERWVQWHKNFDKPIILKYMKGPRDQLRFQSFRALPHGHGLHALLTANTIRI